MRMLALLFVIVGCKEADKPAKVEVKPPTIVNVGSADPWNAAPSATPENELPSLGDRVKLANTACPAVTGPFFFELEKAGKTAHILGTRHISVGLAKFPPIVGATLDHASQVVFEIAPDDTSGMPHTDEPLKKELGDKDWAHYVELVGKDTAQRLEVGQADSAALMMLVIYEDMSNTLESQLQKRAGEHHIPMTGLETSAFQDGVLAKLLDLRMLRATIEQTKDRAEIKKDSLDDLAEYCAGTDDSPGMDEESRQKMLKAGYTQQELDEQDEVLVFRRNADWIPKLTKLFGEKDNVFVAVGADHLIGPRGVIELMVAQGFAARRIKP